MCNDCINTPNGGQGSKVSLYAIAVREFTEDWGLHHCENCTTPFLLAPSKRRRRMYCSNRCRLALVRAEKAAEKPTWPSEQCGERMTGRADRRFCSAACRVAHHRAIASNGWSRSHGYPAKTPEPT
ncbi:hypothetical protein GCM10009696_35390 [Kocuria himachalensis]